jgi:hypothetical protein
VAILGLSLVLPFLLLVKTGVSLYARASLDPWLSLAVGAVVAMVLLSAATTLISYRLRGRLTPSRLTVRAIALIVLAYCVYSVLFISGANVKSEDVAQTYRSLHPLLRVGVSTLVVFDDELVVTDAARVAEDYTTMGLPVNEGSLHYVQATGYVHAVDLRTVGRSPFRNAVVEGYFRLMGFRTLRHVGTADHLHVSLPVR